MSLSSPMLRAIIREHGHLQLDGTEKIQDLRDALMFLSQHTHDKCHRQHYGEPIESLLPDLTALAPRTYAKKSVTNVQRTL